MTKVLADVSEELAATVEGSSDKVVGVAARRRLSATGIVWSTDGVIVTAHHVVESDEDIRVTLSDGQIVSATLVGRDPGTDLAVLRAEDAGLTPPAWADPEGLRVGHLVLALGRPGKDVMATLGIVSALGEGWRTPAGSLLDRYVQPDVVMYPGFSGGPLVDASGLFVGLNTSALGRGVTLTVSAPTLRRVVDELLAHGRIRRAYLGVGAQPTRLPAALSEQLGQETALLILSVEPGGPAEQGGLFLGDVIAMVDGRPMRSVDDLLALLTGDLVGRSVNVRIVRGGQVQVKDLVVGERG